MTLETSIMPFDDSETNAVSAYFDDWHVLHTMSRQEKALARDLSRMQVNHFLPLVRQIRYYGKRKATVELPLFPGYIFLRGTLSDAYEVANTTHRVAQVLPVADQEKLRSEITNLERALAQNATLDPYPFLRDGMAVEVRSGPFRGLQGLIESRFKDHRLVLQVDILGRAVSLEIAGSLLDPIDWIGEVSDETIARHRRDRSTLKAFRACGQLDLLGAEIWTN